MKTVNTHTNVELNLAVELLVSRVVELLSMNADELVVKVAHAHKDNLAETVAIIDSIKSNPQSFNKVFTVVAKHIIMSTVKELPRTTLISIVAELYAKHMKSNSRFRLAAVIVKLFDIVESFATVTKLNTHGHNEYIIICKQKLTQSTLEELRTSTWKLPTSVPSTKYGVAGHIKKQSNANEHMNDILIHLNNVAYTLDERVWNKFKYNLAAYRFEEMSTQSSFVLEGDTLLGKTFYFNHRFGPDNGRIYCDGDLFTLQGGALNYVYKFAEKRVLSEEGMKALREHVDALHHSDHLSFKEQVELYSLTLDLIDAENGLPVGTILHKDAKLSGLQHQAIATRSIALAKYCGLIHNYSDGYTHIRNNLSNSDSLTRDMVKKAFNPYQYGAGELATIKPVRELGGNINYKEWEGAYSKAFPEAFELRKFLLMLSNKYKSDTYSFVSPSGYQACITALGTVETAITTVYGKLHYSRKEVDQEFMGVKLVAAFSHMLDASTLHTVVRKAKYDMHVVHDSFGAHPNDINDVMDNYVGTLQEHLCMPVLENFVTEVLANKANPEILKVNVSRFISNTLTPKDIVGGLF